MEQLPQMLQLACLSLTPNLDFDTYGKEADFAFKEQNLWHPRNPAFNQIVDGDLDGDGLPNFIDPDNDNDGTPDSADTDDDNDGLLDMWDIDDDNDGIPDNCLNVLEPQDNMDGFQNTLAKHQELIVRSTMTGMPTTMPTERLIRTMIWFGTGRTQILAQQTLLTTYLVTHP